MERHLIIERVSWNWYVYEIRSGHKVTWGYGTRRSVKRIPPRRVIV